MINEKLFYRGIWLLLLVLLPCVSEGATLHAILVFDTLSKDIQETVLVDKKNIEKTVERICHYTELESSITLFSGKDFTPKNVKKHLKNLKTQEDDVVLFYYAGHGFRTQSMSDPWPALACPNSSKSIHLSQVIELLKPKSQHFTLILADCCNNVIGAKDIPLLLFQDFGFPRAKFVRESYRRLFLEQRGTLVAIGAEPGDYSHCNENIGGFYTHAFLGMMHHGTKNYQYIDWNSILDMAAKYVKRYQKPYYSFL